MNGLIKMTRSQDMGGAATEGRGDTGFHLLARSEIDYEGKYHLFRAEDEDPIQNIRLRN